MEVDYKSAGQDAEASYGEVGMVCNAVEDRGVSQDSQIRMQGRGVKVADDSALDESSGTLLPDRLEGILDDDGQKRKAVCVGEGGLYED